MLSTYPAKSLKDERPGSTSNRVAKSFSRFFKSGSSSRQGAVESTEVQEWHSCLKYLPSVVQLCCHARHWAYNCFRDSVVELDLFRMTFWRAQRFPASMGSLAWLMASVGRYKFMITSICRNEVHKKLLSAGGDLPSRQTQHSRLSGCRAQVKSSANCLDY